MKKATAAQDAGVWEEYRRLYSRIEERILEHSFPEELKPIATMLARELKRVTKIYSLAIERIADAENVPLPVIAEALEDIANTYLDFADVITSRCIEIAADEDDAKY